MEFLANDYKVIYRVSDPQNVYAYTPGIWVLESGRYVATDDLGGPGAQNTPEAAMAKPVPGGAVGQIFTSDDKGETWQRRAIRNFWAARPFQVNGTVYASRTCNLIA